ncbi:SpoIIE family protein phosphatase [Nocardioides aurantiacus]|uniref:SpoIIE family protein phosphatase n=1 Tax=Nocardioides aurantiacus TaxID=86796 RepID=UPI000F463D61|nr:SpoIIE family protein phosphatase [Nocardioides aurantiacus]
MQRILDDLHVFVEMTEAITSDLDLDRVLQSVTDAGTRLSAARFGAFFYHSSDDGATRGGLRVASGVGPQEFAHLPVPRLVELFSATFAGRETVRLDDVGDDLPDAVRRGRRPLRSYLGTPVVARSGEVIGALLFGHPEVAAFDERSEDVVRLVATQAAVAVENARSYAQEQLARREAEQAAERLALLQTITSRLARADDRDQVLLAVVDTLVGPLGASRVGVYLREGSVYRAAAGVSVAPARGATEAPQRPQHAEFPAEGDNPVAVCAAERRPLVHESVADLAARFPRVGAAVTGMEASVLLPLVVGERTLGVLALAWREPRVFDAVELDWLRSAVEQLSLALLQVELRDSEAAAQAALRDSAAYAISVSQTLQRSLLPLALPDVESLAVAVRYVPSAVDAEVGGDWYDVIATPDGAVVLVIGDVQGHSIGAAAVMGQLRVALNAYLVESHPPHVALARVNRVMETLRTDAIATCCLVRIEPATGHVTVVRAGHTLPLLWRADGEVVEVEGDGGIPLGVLPEWEWPTTELHLGAGDRLLLYTDGLVEVPGEDVDEGVAALLREVATTGSGDGTTAAARDGDVTSAARQERLEDDVDDVLARVGVRARDDVAVLACEYAGPAASYRREELHVATVPEVATARGFGRRTLVRWGLLHLDDVVSLLITELVTNALVHTEGPARLELRRHEGAVRVMVTDSLSKVPRPRAVDSDATGGRGLLVVGALSTEWGVEPRGEGKTVWADVRA